MSYPRTSISTVATIQECFDAGMVIAVIDIATYYRHWLVRPEDWVLQTFQLDVYGDGEGLWFDPYMEFGTRNSPEVANRAAAMFRRSFTRWLHANGYAALAFVVVNTDDWLLCAQPSVADHLYEALRNFLHAMGFTLNDVKSCRPGPQQTYAGWIIDSVRMCIRLTPAPLAKTLTRVRELLAVTGPIAETTWNSLFGYMQHVSTVVPWGSAWLHGIGACKDAAARAGASRCSPAAREELQWWEQHVTTFDGCRLYLGPRRPTPDSSLTICTDATGTGSVGIFVHGTALWSTPATTAAYFGDAFDTACTDAQVWELAAFVMLVEGFGAMLAARGVRAITWRTDSSSAQSALNRAAHRNANCLRLLRRVGSTLHRLNIAVCALHVAGDTNILPDCLSRWHEPGKQAEFAIASAAWSDANNTSVDVQEWSTWLSGQSSRNTS
jgi:hypothetical protein